MLIGYARVSTDDQNLDPQVALLKSAGTDVIYSEHESGGKNDRPELAKAMRALSPGDTLLVTKIDRLARDQIHLQMTVKAIVARQAHFRSLGDPIDTSSPQGWFMLQLLGSFAEFERSRIKERTREGLAHARAQGRVGGNPRLRAGDPSAAAEISLRRQQQYMEQLARFSHIWVPIVRELRPERTWGVVTKTVNNALQAAGIEIATGGTRSRRGDRAGAARQHMSQQQLVRAVKTYVADYMLPKEVLAPALSSHSDDLVTLVASMKNGRPDMTLAQVGQELKRLRRRTPRGQSEWGVSSVASLLRRAQKQGLLD